MIFEIYSPTKRLRSKALFLTNLFQSILGPRAEGVVAALKRRYEGMFKRKRNTDPLQNSTSG